MSARAQRAAARRARRRPAVLNIVSLIDVFAILVFFLLANALAQQVLTPPHALQPAAAQEASPARRQASVVLGVDELQLDGDVIARGARPDDAATLAALQAALRARSVRSLNLLADRRLDYGTVGQVLDACRLAGASAISLAVVEARVGEAR